ncbi:hypothetical protein GGR57DRAFT_9073 [Xylariaceae sp. FL1272]|nr:hypothetical protein GGR57DRAFT_9073 [Xylariaceae sp. FL1272]
MQVYRLDRCQSRQMYPYRLLLLTWEREGSTRATRAYHLSALINPNRSTLKASTVHTCHPTSITVRHDNQQEHLHFVGCRKYVNSGAEFYLVHESGQGEDACGWLRESTTYNAHRRGLSRDLSLPVSSIRITYCYVCAGQGGVDAADNDDKPSMGRVIGGLFHEQGTNTELPPSMSGHAVWVFQSPSRSFDAEPECCWGG